MFENRPLSPAEGRLRHQSGSDNLIEHPAEWYSLMAVPGGRLTLGSVLVIVAGPDLLSYIDKFGTRNGTLDLALELTDRFGVVHDITSSTVHTIEQAAEWRRGEHHGTKMDPDAGLLEDGSRRAGLRGADLMSVPPTSVYWISAPVMLLNGREVEGLVWDIDDVREPSGAPMGAFKIIVRLGQSGAGGSLTWDPWQVVTNRATPASRVYSFSEPLPAADAIQWRVDLQYGSGSASNGETRIRTPTIFLLGTWVRLASPRLRFESLGDLVGRADERILLQEKGWNGIDDVAILRISLGIPLNSSPAEAVRVRFVGDAFLPPSLTCVRVQCIGGIVFEDAE